MGKYFPGLATLAALGAPVCLGAVPVQDTRLPDHWERGVADPRALVFQAYAGYGLGERVTGPPPRWLKAQVRRYFEPGLNDGASTRWLWTHQRGSAGTYCGWFNATDGRGSYAGYQPFMVRYRGRRVIDGRISGPNDPWLLVLECNRRGYDMSAPPGD